MFVHTSADLVLSLYFVLLIYHVGPHGLQAARQNQHTFVRFFGVVFVVCFVHGAVVMYFIFLAVYV